MRSKEEIQAKLDSLVKIDNFTANTQRNYLLIGLDKDEEYLESLILKYSARIMEEEYELREDRIIMKILQWMVNKDN